MEKNVIVYTIIFTLLMLLGLIFVIKEVFIKQKNSRNISDILIKIFVISCACIITWYRFIPLIIDTPMILKKEYIKVTGKSTYDSLEQKGLEKQRSMTFELDNNEKIDIYVLSDGIKKEEYYEIHYLPHLKIGCIHKIEENKQS